MKGLFYTLTKQTIFLLLFINSTHIYLYGQEYQLPYYSSKEKPIFHTGYSLLYSEEHEQPLWVAYTLTLSMMNNQIKRTNKFKEDPFIPTKSATLDDYKNSGYDRGHLAPAGDMKSSYKMLSDSFYLSNVSPQLSHFNQGIWHNLEKWVRRQAEKYDKVYVVTGPIFTLSNKKPPTFLPPNLVSLSKEFAKNHPPIGKNRVTVPFAFYKAVVVIGEKPKGIAFLIPQTANKKEPLFKYCLSIDQLEELAQIDFFYSLPTHLQDELEARTYW